MSETISGAAFIAKWEAREISEIGMVAQIGNTFYVFTKGPTQEGGLEEQKVWVVTV